MNTSFIRRVLKTPLPEDKEYELNLFEAEIEKEKQEEEEKLEQYATELEEGMHNEDANVFWKTFYSKFTGTEPKGTYAKNIIEEFKAYITEHPESLEGKSDATFANMCKGLRNSKNFQKGLLKIINDTTKANAEKQKNEAQAAQDEETVEVTQDTTEEPTKETPPTEDTSKDATVDNYDNSKSLKEFVKFLALANANKSEENQPQGEQE